MSMAGSRKTIECLLTHAAVLVLRSTPSATRCSVRDPHNPAGS